MIIDKFYNFRVCFDPPYLLNIPAQVILDFVKSWVIAPGDWEIKIEYKICIELNDYSLKILELVMISA